MLIHNADLRAPVRTPETNAFWDAANEEVLLYAKCRDCGKPHYYPRKVCPFCFSTKVDFLRASGLAKVYAFSLFYKGRPPYISAWVMLNEGVAILSNIIECDSDNLKIGATIKVVFRAVTDGQKIPVFVPFSGNSLGNSGM
jgi:uncharacterized OB-fold protein